MDSHPPPEPAPGPVDAHLGFPIVGIGASAGGIPVVRRLLESLPARTGMAFVVVMHLSPDHDSTLGNILDRVGHLPVATVVERTRIESDHVYVISPAMSLTMRAGQLQVSALDAPGGPRQSIDHFFSTLAEAHAERAIGIVLSGSGSDGAHGLTRIKAHGGVAIVQRPEDAEFDGMPRAALETGVVDLVLSVDEMPGALQRLGTEGHRVKKTAPSGVPDETQALLQDLLIGVTNFFRDPVAFDALRAALALVLADRADDEPFRVWVVGCATGEEAYSVAILLRELLESSAPIFQLFASDIDVQAIAVARSGSFPASIADDLSPERLERHFVAGPAGFRVVKSLREPIVFSTHNVLSDPPFVRMDLICCRNVLIDLDRSAQDQLLRNVRCALRPRGLLFLGRSETPDVADGLFDAVDPGHRIYRARAAAPSPSPSPLERLHERVVQAYGPPSVLVDADATVLHVGRNVSHLLRLGEGPPSDKLTALVRPDLRAGLRAALTQAARTGESVEAPRVRLDVDGTMRTILITVRPARHETPEGVMLVVFDEVAHRLDAAEDVRDGDPVVTTPEMELTRTRELLRTTVAESDASTEELRASNEELQTINEELRSTTEELELSREELQSVNEELTAVNGELTRRVDEATRARDDWQNLMTSARIGAVFVDRAVRVKRCSPEAATLFNVLPSDIGRPLFDLTHRLDYPELSDDIAEVLRDLSRVEREVRSRDGRRLFARIAPYQASGGQIDGAVIALLEVRPPPVDGRDGDGERRAG